MSEHTPGPWHTQPNDPWEVYASDGTTICDVRNRGSQIAEANARLIAAAPAMEEALQEVLLGLMAYMQQNGDHGGRLMRLGKLASDALALTE